MGILWYIGGDLVGLVLGCREKIRDRERVVNGGYCMLWKKFGIYFVEYRENDFVNNFNINLL